jgi:hypothetical protein
MFAALLFFLSTIGPTIIFFDSPDSAEPKVESPKLFSRVTTRLFLRSLSPSFDVVSGLASLFLLLASWYTTLISSIVSSS